LTGRALHELVKFAKHASKELPKQEDTMWRSILAVLLVPSLAAAQAQQTTSAGAEPPASQSSGAAGVIPARYESHTFHDGIRRGTEEEVAIQWWPGGFLTISKSAVAGIVPLHFEVQAAEGLRFSSFRYPKAYPQSFKFQADPVPVVFYPSIRFSVHAEANAALGSRVLIGRITFQVIHQDSSLGPVEHFDVPIPVTVVEHDAPIHRVSTWPYPHHSAGFWIGLILLAPLLIVVMAPYYLICSIGGPSHCTD